MITSYALLGVLLGLPLLLGLVFRVGTSHLFLALLGGELLERYFKEDVVLVLRPLVRNSAVSDYAGLAILVLPMVLTAVFLHHTLSRGKAILHSIPLVITGIVFAAFAVPLLSPSLEQYIDATAAGRWLQDSTDIIVGAMVFLQLIALWLFNRSTKHEGHKSHKSHH